jgi:pimeloyl-ACP methyl ester carboxylesterase
VVLVAPAPARPAEVNPQAREALAHAYDSAETVRTALDQVLTHRPLPGQLRKRVIADSRAGTEEARLAWPRHGIAVDISDRVGAIEAPVLVLAGERDRVDPPAVLAEHLLPVLPTATMAVLGSTGHLSPLEVPDQLAARLDRFVADLDERRPARI